jgi:hypothetical protein
LESAIGARASERGENRRALAGSVEPLTEPTPRFAELAVASTPEVIPQCAKEGNSPPSCEHALGRELRTSLSQSAGFLGRAQS